MITEAKAAMAIITYTCIGYISSLERRPAEQPINQPNHSNYGIPGGYCREDSRSESCLDNTLEIFLWPLCLIRCYSEEYFKNQDQKNEEKKHLTEPETQEAPEKERSSPSP